VLVLVSKPRLGGAARRFVIFGQWRRAAWRVNGAPGSHGGDQTSQHHQEPWCQSALPRGRVRAPARVAAARAATPPIPAMPSGRCLRRCCRPRRARPQRVAARRRTAAGRWWTRSGMWFITGACGGRCPPTSRPGAPSMASTSGGMPAGPPSPCTTHYAARPATRPGATPSRPRW
jgi:hypothetical protein